MLELSAIFISLTALLAYLNYRFIGLPLTIGVMATALVFSLLAAWVDHAGPAAAGSANRNPGWPDRLHHLLMDGMLSFLLFAGALHINLADLRARRWAIGLLATVGVLFSTAVIDFGSWWILDLFGQQRSSLTESAAPGLGLPAVTAIIAGLHTADTVRPCPPPVRGALQQGESLFWIKQATRLICRAAADPNQVSPVRLGQGVNHTHQRRPFAQNEWRTL